MFIDAITFVEVFAVKNFGKVLHIIFLPITFATKIITNPFSMYHF